MIVPALTKQCPSPFLELDKSAPETDRRSVASATERDDDDGRLFRSAGDGRT